MDQCYDIPGQPHGMIHVQQPMQPGMAMAQPQGMMMHQGSAPVAPVMATVSLAHL